MALTVRDDSDLKIGLQSYLALTSNTAQVGARIDVHATKGNYAGTGHLSFDALFQFSPFSFVLDMSASFAITRKGESLTTAYVALQLSGPSPWSASGSGCFEVLKAKVDFEFSKVWGVDKRASLPSVNVGSLVEDALKENGNWNSEAPTNDQMLVTLRNIDNSGASELLLRPNGVLVVRQKVVPLDKTINIFGNQPLTGPTHFAITSIAVAGDTLSCQAVTEEFAPAQFEAMSDAQKLSRPSFEKMPAGVRAQSADVSARIGDPIRRFVEYETKILDTPFRLPWHVGIGPIWATAFDRLLADNAAARSYGAAANLTQIQAAQTGISLMQEQYSVVHTADLRRVGTNLAFASQSEALEYMNTIVAEQPWCAGKFQVVPDFEAREAA